MAIGVAAVVRRCVAIIAGLVALDAGVAARDDPDAELTDGRTEEVVLHRALARAAIAGVRVAVVTLLGDAARAVATALGHWSLVDHVAVAGTSVGAAPVAEAWAAVV